jgi:hypothetical protein
LSSSLDKLLANPRVWRGRDQGRQKAGLATGYVELDRHLPGGGWPPASLTEILTAHYGIGELRLLMPALARLSTASPQHDFTEPGWLAWVAPPFQPYPPALQQCGIDLSRMLIVRPKNASEILWSAEQALSSGTCAAVLLWPETLDDQASRRLQLAAEKVAAGPSHFGPWPHASKTRRQHYALNCIRVHRVRAYRFSRVVAVARLLSVSFCR